MPEVSDVQDYHYDNGQDVCAWDLDPWPCDVIRVREYYEGKVRGLVRETTRLQRCLDHLHGVRFSERVYLALVARAKKAEERAITLEAALDAALEYLRALGRSRQ